ncbi:hypothetical protein [Nocardioides bigeumensis]|jgi:hypothetical protein|uniref:Uncharacterized protein n=1 Tax=Nocardioides bigeumensis TaxID=433657 RepID=A0ABN2Y080_9ACTN
MALILSVIATFLQAAPANAYRIDPAQMTIFLNKAETKTMAIGYGACTTVAGTFPWVWTKAVVPYCGLATVVAATAIDAGKCLRLYMMWNGAIVPGHYTCAISTSPGGGGGSW